MRICQIRPMYGVLVGSHHPFEFLFPAVEPVRRPDPVEGPAKSHQMRLPQTVAIPRCGARVVGGAITLDGQDWPAWLLRVHHSKVDAVARSAELRPS